MLELIIVITIIGFLSTAGMDIFLNIYKTYFESRTHNEIQARTQLALDQIANRLTYRVKPSVIVSWGNANNYTSIESADSTTTGTDNYRLEWVAYDNDSFRGMAESSSDTYIKPGWSGFIDLDVSNGGSLHTPGGNTTAAEMIMRSLSDGDINFTTPTGTSDVVMIFPDAPGSVNQYGWFNSGDTNLTHPVQKADDQTLIPVAPRDFRGINNEVYENYQLAFSAYALEYNTTSRSLWLYYNYQPWNGETFRDGNRTLFLENVSNFIFTQVGSILKVQLCVNRSDYDASISDEQYSLCKERAIF